MTKCDNIVALILQELSELVNRANVNVQEAVTLIVTLKKINRAQENV